MLEYILKEKRNYSPYFDLHFIVKIDDETTRDFTFPLYNETRPFSEEQYIIDVEAEIAYEVGLISNPPIEPEPTPL
jgi:hypothetical protein